MSTQIKTSPSPFLTLLQQINDGIRIFEPFLRTPQGMQEFRDTVARLQEMETLGLIGKLFIQTRIYRGEEHTELVMIRGGLTEDGKRLLLSQEILTGVGVTKNEPPQ